MLFKTRLFIGVAILVFLVAKFNQEPKNTAPVQKAERVESVNVADLNELCEMYAEDELRLKTTFESDVWCWTA